MIPARGTSAGRGEDTGSVLRRRRYDLGMTARFSRGGFLGLPAASGRRSVLIG